MSTGENGGAEPTRHQLLRSVFEASPLGAVSEAVAVATAYEDRLYVERFPAGWRWSLAHRGGGYPLLRITARFLQVKHHRIMVGFRTLPNGWSILCEDPQHPWEPVTSAIMSFGRHANPAVVERRILDGLGDGRADGRG